VLDIIRRPGAWKRAGMGGDLYGLDMIEAMSSLPDDDDCIDYEFARRLFRIAEVCFLSAHNKRVAEEQ
jgi:hypothetical protein